MTQEIQNRINQLNTELDNIESEHDFEDDGSMACTVADIEDEVRALEYELVAVNLTA